MSDNLENNELNEMPKASAAPTGSGDSNENVAANKKAIFEMSNASVLKGYDMALDILQMHGNTEGIEQLAKFRPMIKLGLDNIMNEQT